ncbi:M28 family peptidase [Fundicoccus sp. Sow4_D5]|uniref:M28 family peptidase n=1 Tax=Fundicoccus sp. Sow4_D5 TaxID=3438782 RepID=UPI003F8DFCCB
MKKKLMTVALGGLLALQTALPSQMIFAQDDVLGLEALNQQFIETVDATYGYDLAVKLGEFQTNPDLGYRTAGSDAEHQAGDFLFEEMSQIGLSNVTKDEFNLDSWTFEKANLSFTDAEGNDYSSILGAYQVNFDTEGPQEFEVVYVNKGTEADYEGLDVTGKLVLIDIDQREEWWINYPAYEAKLNGAAAVIAVQEASFSEISPDALNANDLIGPADTPAFSMSQTDADVLKAALAAQETPLSVTFDAKTVVEEATGTAYNIVGQIEGKDPDAYIVLSAHYDAYFSGFQDNSTAVGIMLGIAKALVEMDYQPEKTIIFMAVAAEEWGAVNTRYDWSTGAYNQLFTVHLDWQDKVMYNINFEMPGVEHFETHYVMAVRELESFLSDFVATVPAFEGDAYSDGIEVTSPVNTWADDFSFAIAGIPSVRNSFDDADFGITTYHTQFDDTETHHDAAYLHNHILYGLMTLKYDQTAVLPLDFTATTSAIEASIDQAVFAKAGVDSQSLSESNTQVTQAAETINRRIAEINAAYTEALNKGNQEEAANLYAESRELNTQLKQAFRLVQDEFTKLTWEDEPYVGHEIITNNLTHLYAAVEALENGELALTFDDYLWAVDNNWYAYTFSKENFDYFNQYVLDQPAERLFWGAGRVVGHVDLFDVIESLEGKLEDEAVDVSTEIDALRVAISEQEALLGELAAQETVALEALVSLLK